MIFKIFIVFVLLMLLVVNFSITAILDLELRQIREKLNKLLEEMGE